MVKKCDFLTEYITEYPRRQEISRILMNRPPSPPPKPPALPPEEVDEIVDNLLETDEIHFYPREELELILANLRKRRAEFQAQGEYLKAQKTDYYTKAILNYGQLGEVEKMQDSKVNDIKAKLNEAIEQSEKDKKKWETLYQNLKNEAIQDMSRINEGYEKEIEELQKLEEKDPPANFRKYSSAYLQLRKRQQAMILARKYEEAANTKDKADEMQKKEDEEQKQKWIKSISIMIEKKKSEQAKALKARQNHWSMEEKTMTKQANHEIEKSEKSIEHIKKSLKEAENAHNMASTLKETTKLNAAGLPPLKSSSSLSQANEYRQRAILNTKIYTRPVTQK
jgi:DNA repair exonuclease SbcCD ATPase subunit